MAYTFDSNETVAHAVRRIATEQLDHALDELSSESTLDRVHEARKHLKKVRALLSLVREHLDGSYREENASLRDSGRLLAPLRDAEALVESFDALRDRFASELRSEPGDRVRQAFVERRQRLARKRSDVEPQIAEVVVGLRAARCRAAKWKLTARGFDALEPGFRRTVRRAKRTMAKAYAAPSDESCHEWRKRVKAHWYHMRLLINAWPAMLEVGQAALKQLSDVLGDDHDLTILRQVLCGEPALLPDAGAREDILKLIDRRKSELREDARPLGQRLFAGSAKSRGRQMRAYWDAWKGESSRGSG